MSYVSESKIAGTMTSKTKYASQCGVDFSNLKTQRLLPRREEYVTSWRGPIETVNVGSKKRRVHRRFNIKKFYGAEPSFDSWCPAPGKYYNGINIFYAQCLYAIESFKTGKYASYFDTSQVPRYYLEDYVDLTEDVRSRKVTDLFVKLKDPRFDSAVFLAELGETLTSIQGIFKGCLKSYMKAGKVKGLPSSMPGTAIAATVKTLIFKPEELWLWYRYFLLPAMMDAEDLMEAMKPLKKIDRVGEGMARKTVKEAGTIFSDGITFTGETMDIKWSQSSTYRSGGAIDLSYRYDPSPWGTSAMDVFRAGWEIIPFSFVFDWFVEFGDWLATMRDVAVEIEQSYATYALDSTLIFRPPSGGTMSTDVGVLRQVLIDRVIDLEPPTHPMANKQWANALRVCDGLSLLAGILKGIMAKGARRR